VTLVGRVEDGALIVTVMPNVPPSPELARALAVRVQAATTGRCPCGATVQMPSREARRKATREGRALRVTFHHEHDCAATDESIKRLTAAALS
jgi:hypothetical protein